VEIKGTNSGKLLILIFVFSAVSLALAAAGLFVRFPGSGFDVEKAKKVAAELLDKKFYPQAAGFYEKILIVGRVTTQEEARLRYTLADLYMNHIGDYEAAAAHLLASRVLDPHPDYERDRAEKLVFALERSGRSEFAKQESGYIPPGGTPDTGEVLAAFGSRRITRAELEKEFAAAPPEVQATYAGPDGKRKFLEQYVSIELVHQSALRRGFDQDPNFPHLMERARREALVQRVLDEDIGRHITITEAEVSRFYDENKAAFGGRPLAEVSQQAAFLLRQKKEQEGYKELVSRLGKAEKVQFFDEQKK
jgi:hypothetical protein